MTEADTGPRLPPPEPGVVLSYVQLGIPLSEKGDSFKWMKPLVGHLDPPHLDVVAEADAGPLLVGHRLVPLAADIW